MKQLTLSPWLAILLYFQAAGDALREFGKKLLYEIYYPDACDVLVGEHYCNTCEEIEHGRVRSIAYIKKDYVFADPSNPVEWRTGIENKDIIVIAEVLGSYNGGDPQVAPGYGDQSERLTGYNHELNFKDPNYKNNADFYNSLKYSRNYKIAWRTETQIHISENPVSVRPKNPVTEELTSDVVWDVANTWSSADLSKPYDTPVGIFECFDYVAE